MPEQHDLDFNVSEEFTLTPFEATEDVPDNCSGFRRVPQFAGCLRASETELRALLWPSSQFLGHSAFLPFASRIEGVWAGWFLVCCPSRKCSTSCDGWHRSQSQEVEWCRTILQSVSEGMTQKKMGWNIRGKVMNFSTSLVASLGAEGKAWCSVTKNKELRWRRVPGGRTNDRKPLDLHWRLASINWWGSAQVESQVSRSFSEERPQSQEMGNC